MRSIIKLIVDILLWLWILALIVICAPLVIYNWIIRRRRGWAADHKGRDSFYYCEKVNGRWEEIEIGGEMLVGKKPHHLIYLPDDESWQTAYPHHWTTGRRTIIADRIKSKLKPGSYEYVEFHYKPPSECLR